MASKRKKKEEKCVTCNYRNICDSVECLRKNTKTATPKAQKSGEGDDESDWLVVYPFKRSGSCSKYRARFFVFYNNSCFFIWNMVEYALNYIDFVRLIKYIK